MPFPAQDAKAGYSVISATSKSSPRSPHSKKPSGSGVVSSRRMDSTNGQKIWAKRKQPYLIVIKDDRWFGCEPMGEVDGQGCR